MKLLSQKEVHTYAMYLNLRYMRQDAYQAVITVRKAQALLNGKITDILAVKW